MTTTCPACGNARFIFAGTIGASVPCPCVALDAAVDALEVWVDRALTAELALAAALERVRELEAACRLRIADWDNVTQRGAACEGCADTDDVAAMRHALAPRTRSGT